MGYESFIAHKQMTHRKKTGFIPLVSMISVTGIALGVMALIVVLSVMSGFHRELRQKIIGMQPHVMIEKVGGIEDSALVKEKITMLDFQALESSQGYVQGQGLVRSRTNAIGVLVRGVESGGPDLDVVAKHMIRGGLVLSDAEVQDPTNERKTIKAGRLVMGLTLARLLGVTTGDIIYVISPRLDNTDDIVPTKAYTLPFLVAGVFEIGMNDFDSGILITSLDRAGELFGMQGRLTGIGLRFADPIEANTYREQLGQEFDYPFYARSWIDLNRNFFGALKMEKTVLTILMTLIVLVAAFNIVSGLTMVVMEKTKDIGVLRALGATRQGIRYIFMLQGFVQGFIGTSLGAGLGLLVAARLNDIAYFLERTFHIEIFPKDVYNFDKIPTHIGSDDILFIVICALILAIVAGVYPAHRASRVNMVDAIRYE